MKRRTLLRHLCVGAMGAPLLAYAAQSTAKAAEHAGAPHWGYTGDAGPEHWGALAPDFKTCSFGKQQSPVDIAGPIEAKLGDLEIAYQAAPLRILNNGHTVQINYAPGSSLTTRGRSYEVVQFHFHTPSEHTVSGRHYPMELHIVHQTAAKELAVLGVFLDAGTANTALAPIWDAMPMHEAPEASVPGVTINVKSLLPASLAYYEYLGSLTTPPCTENVLWLVARTPVSVSEAQIAKFKQAFPMDARPVQPLNQRFVFQEET